MLVQKHQKQLAHEQQGCSSPGVAGGSSRDQMALMPHLCTVPEPRAGLLCSLPARPPYVRTFSQQTLSGHLLRSTASCRCQRKPGVPSGVRKLATPGTRGNSAESCFLAAFCTNGPLTPGPLFPFACSFGLFVLPSPSMLVRAGGNFLSRQQVAAGKQGSVVYKRVICQDLRSL